MNQKFKIQNFHSIKLRAPYTKFFSVKHRVHKTNTIDLSNPYYHVSSPEIIRKQIQLSNDYPNLKIGGKSENSSRG